MNDLELLLEDLIDRVIKSNYDYNEFISLILTGEQCIDSKDPDFGVISRYYEVLNNAPRSLFYDIIGDLDHWSKNIDPNDIDGLIEIEYTRTALRRVNLFGGN